jgi:beta-barrel assembly-enhancing protease
MKSKLLYLIPLLAGTAAAQGVNFYSLDREIALGEQLAQAFRRDTRPVESPAALAYVEAIGRRLTAELGGPPFEYRFALFVDDRGPAPEVVAFPGGLLFVPSSLILGARDEDELAGLLAHAIAHVAARDGTRLATRTELMNIAAIPLETTAGWAGDAMRNAQALALPLSLLQMQRKAELAADQAAARAMANAGYDPEALARYIERVQPADETKAGIWSPLPRRSARVQAIRELGLAAQPHEPRAGLTTAQDEVRKAIR